MLYSARLSHGKNVVLCFDTFSHTLERTHVDMQLHLYIFLIAASNFAQHDGSIA
jgi:hypothetical protein